MTHDFEPLFYDPLECHVCGKERAHAHHTETDADRRATTVHLDDPDQPAIVSDRRAK